MKAVAGRIHINTVSSSLEGRGPKGRRISRGLMIASMIGDASAVSKLLDSGANPNTRDDNGRTPLMEAAFGGHVDVVAALLRFGADPNVGDDDGWTPLMEAASKGWLIIVRWLLTSGANPNARTQHGWTALAATARDHSQIARLLKRCGAIN